jgi:hypothetical protein
LRNAHSDNYAFGDPHSDSNRNTKPTTNGYTYANSATDSDAKKQSNTAHSPYSPSETKSVTPQ